MSKLIIDGITITNDEIIEAVNKLDTFIADVNSPREKTFFFPRNVIHELNAHLKNRGLDKNIEIAVVLEDLCYFDACYLVKKTF